MKLKDLALLLLYLSPRGTKADYGLDGLYGQCYHANGDPVGEEFLVTTHSCSPAVAMSTGGNFVVVWE